MITLKKKFTVRTVPKSIQKSIETEEEKL